jgi:hypothetical protein
MRRRPNSRCQSACLAVGKLRKSTLRMGGLMQGKKPKGEVDGVEVEVSIDEKRW